MKIKIEISPTGDIKPEDFQLLSPEIQQNIVGMLLDYIANEDEEKALQIIREYYAKRRDALNIGSLLRQNKEGVENGQKY